MSDKFKIVVSGPKNAGKSCLLSRFIDDFYHDFDSSSNPIGRYEHDGAVKILDLQKRTPCQLRLWEYSGSNGDVCYPDHRMFQRVDGVLLVIDATDYKSFTDLEPFVETAQRGISSNTVVMVVLNKIDDEPHQAVVSLEVKEFCQERGLLYEETSAKTGKNVEKVFRDLSFAMQAKKMNPTTDIIAMQREADRATTEPRAALTAAIGAHIETLQREILETFSCNRRLKQLKIDVLLDLIKAVERQERSSIRTLITQARTANPFLDRGLLSHRTRDLLNQYSQ